MSPELCLGPLKCHMIMFFYDLQLQLWSQNWMKLKLWYFLKFRSVRGWSEADTAAHVSLSGHHHFIRVQLKIITAPYPGFILKGSAGMLLQPRGCVESHKKQTEDEGLWMKPPPRRFPAGENHFPASVSSTTSSASFSSVPVSSNITPTPRFDSRSHHRLKKPDQTWWNKVFNVRHTRTHSCTLTHTQSWYTTVIK